MEPSEVAKRPVSNYKDLIVWQKAHLLAVKTIQFVGGLPKTLAAEIIARQLLSAATSIGANIAEGHGRGGRRQYAQYLSIARGSANETDNWLNLMKDAGLGTHEGLSELSGLCEEVLKMLTRMLRPIS